MELNINGTVYLVSAAVVNKMVPATSDSAYNVAGTSDSAYTLDPSVQGGASGKDTLLSSWPFVIGISAGVLLVSVALGTFLARRKIKKGIELYED